MTSNIRTWETEVNERLAALEKDIGFGQRKGEDGKVVSVDEALEDLQRCDTVALAWADTVNKRLKLQNEINQKQKKRIAKLKRRLKRLEESRD